MASMGECQGKKTTDFQKERKGSYHICQKTFEKYSVD